MGQAKQAHALPRRGIEFEIARDRRTPAYYWSELQRVTDPRRAADLIRCWALAWLSDHRLELEDGDDVYRVLFDADSNARTLTIAAATRQELKFYLEHWGYLRAMPQSCGEWIR